LAPRGPRVPRNRLSTKPEQAVQPEPKIETEAKVEPKVDAEAKAEAPPPAGEGGEAAAAAAAVEDPPKKSWFKMRYVFAALGLVGFWYSFDVQAKRETTNEMRDYVVSAGVQEIAEIAGRSDISKMKMQELIEGAANYFKNAKYVSPDAFGVYLIETTGSQAIEVWDMHPFLRNSPTDKRGNVDLLDCLVGAAMLIDTEEPNDRAQLAWNIADTDSDGKLTLKQFETLLRRLIQTGHFDGSTILRRVEWIPPTYNVLSAEGVAEHLYEKLGLDKAHDSISWEQFAELMKSEKVKKTGQLWYYGSNYLKKNKPSN
jgi:hypothetical protein